MELWIQNDGFLHRLAQLSQDEVNLEDETMEVLRKDLRHQKALEITESAFLARLDWAVWHELDPNEESFGALQSRWLAEYLPHVRTEPNDVGSYLLELAKCDAEGSPPHKVLVSEILAAMVYDKFRGTDLRDRAEVKRLGRGLRDLFWKEPNLSAACFEDLCGTQISPEYLLRAYGM